MTPKRALKDIATGLGLIFGALFLPQILSVALVIISGIIFVYAGVAHLFSKLPKEKKE